jgi:hypothetical protein
MTFNIKSVDILAFDMPPPHPFYSKFIFPKEAQGMLQNILSAEYHGTFPNTPLHNIHTFCQSSQNKFGLKEEIEHQQFMSAHKLAPLTFGLMHICLIGKNPIFPHFTWKNINFIQNQGFILSQANIALHDAMALDLAVETALGMLNLVPMS